MSRTKTNTAAVVIGVAILVFLATTLAFAGETSSTSAIAVQTGATEHAAAPKRYSGPYAAIAGTN